jgi:beta-galactosidase
VHVFTSGDEVELFLNGRSLGIKRREAFEYRFRWDEVVYEPGVLKAVAYRNGVLWAEHSVQTTGKPVALKATPDCTSLESDGRDLSFVTIQVTDKEGWIVPDASLPVIFSIEGPGEIMATDNGDPTDLTPFPSLQRNLFNGLGLAVVRSGKNAPGRIILTVSSPGLESASAEIECR